MGAMSKLKERRKRQNKLSGFVAYASATAGGGGEGGEYTGHVATREEARRQREMVVVKSVAWLQKLVPPALVGLTTSTRACSTNQAAPQAAPTKQPRSTNQAAPQAGEATARTRGLAGAGGAVCSSAQAAACMDDRIGESSVRTAVEWTAACGLL